MSGLLITGLPVRRAHVLHHGPECQLVVTLDVGADVGTELACPLVLNIIIILLRYFQNYDVYNYNLNLVLRLREYKSGKVFPKLTN